MPALAAEVHFGRLRVCLRELTGADELLVQRDDTRTALALLDALIVDSEGGWPAPGQAAALTAPERDRLLAELWIRTWGPVITGSPVCARCTTRYDTRFDLDELCRALWPAPPPTRLEVEGQGFRVPTGADELAVLGLPADLAVDRLAARCAEEPGGELPPEGLARALDQGAPVLDLDLDARCPECGHANDVGFRMQSYLLTALADERARLPGQMHTLALAYGWGVGEILDLPRSTRVALVRLAEGATSPRRAP